MQLKNNSYPKKLTYCLIIVHIIKLMLLAKCKLDKWFHLFKNEELSGKKGFPLKPDDVMMSSNVHIWKGKPRSI